jgi:integrase/recombinase XerC/integrase/recombinase XerD
VWAFLAEAANLAPATRRRKRAAVASFCRWAVRHGGYVALLKLYLAQAEYRFGPLFRASINGIGGPSSYDAAHHRWKTYCATAGVDVGIHQLRHAHATELFNSGVSIQLGTSLQAHTLHDQSQRRRLYRCSSTPVTEGETHEISYHRRAGTGR